MRAYSSSCGSRLPFRRRSTSLLHITTFPLVAITVADAGLLPAMAMRVEDDEDNDEDNAGSEAVEADVEEEAPGKGRGNWQTSHHAPPFRLRLQTSTSR